MINMKDLIKKQTDMIRKESGMNITEAVDKPKVGDYFEWDSWLKLGQIIKVTGKVIWIKPLKGPASRGAVDSISYDIKKIKLWGQHKGKKLWAPK